MQSTAVQGPPLNRPRTPLVQHLWLVALGVGLGSSALTNFWLPDDHAALDALYLGTMALACGGMIIGTTLWRAADAVTVAWRIMCAGMLLYLLGEATWIWYARRGLEPFPSVADAMYIAGIATMIAAAFLLARTRRDQTDDMVVLDTAIIAIAVGAVLWTVTILPYADDPQASVLDRLIAGAYPLLDVFLVAIIARIMLAGGRLPVGFVLPVVGLGIWSITDIVYYQQVIHGSYSEWSWVDFGYMVGYVVAAAGALHPASVEVDNVRARPPQIDRLRLVVLAVFAAIPLIAIDAGELLGIDTNTGVLALASSLLVVLVLARTWKLVRLNGRLGEMRSDARFTSMIRNSSDAVVVVDDDHRITYACPALERKWGWCIADLVAQPIHTVFGHQDPGQLDRWLGAVERGDAVVPIEIALIAADGSTTSVSVVASDLRDDPDISGIVLTGRDISHRVELENQLRHDAAHDALTGLLNRGGFSRRLDETLQRRTGAGSTLLFLDVDDFKEINDQFGHAVGDRVLVELGARLAVEMRQDDIVARLGGDEFAVVVDRQDTERLAERIRALAASIDIEVLARPVTVSIGWYELEPGTAATEALRRADLAMYEAKRTGKGRLTRYDMELGHRAQHRLAVRNGLRCALERDELRLVYQDIVRVSDGVRVGREALLRWQSAELGPISPAAFVPTAEEMGLIDAIGTWALHGACVDAVDELRGTGSTPVVSVNVSPLQLDHGFDRVVDTVLRETGLEPDRLQLELTESVMTHSNAADVLGRIRGRGVRLAIDDFGSGYSSLGYLRRFHVDTIKIDRALVTGCDDDPRLLAGVVRLINSMGATALAEGVETEAECATVAELGIPLAQGFFWHRPAPLGRDVRVTADEVT